MLYGVATMEYETVLDAVRGWPSDAQLRLAMQIRDDLNGESLTPDLQELLQRLDGAEEEAACEDELSPEIKLELDRRIAAHKANPESAIPWTTVLEKLRAKSLK
jgi:putative addiction module component (TIGR02574 family)